MLSALRAGWLGAYVGGQPSFDKLKESLIVANTLFLGESLDATFYSGEKRFEANCCCSLT